LARWWKYALHAGVVVGLVAVGVKYVSGKELWQALRGFDWRYLPVVLLCTLLYVSLKALRFVLLFRRVNRAPVLTVLKAYLAGQAYAVLPGGIAARAALLGEAGVPLQEGGAVVAASSLADNAALVLGAMVAALWAEAARKPALILLTGLVILSVVLGMEASRFWLFDTLDRLMGRLKVRGRWREFIESCAEMLTVRAVLTAFGLACLALLVLVFALDLTLEGLNLEVPYTIEWLAVSLPNVMGRISALPLGIGVTEAGMVGILDSGPGVRLDHAAAATVLFRLLTVGVEVLVGAAVYAFAWRGRRERARNPEPEPVSPGLTPG
jgi:uncharacterized protein (TIRG00374 family)